MTVVVLLQPRRSKGTSKKKFKQSGNFFYIEADRFGEKRKKEGKLSDTRTLLQGFSFIQLYSITSVFMTEFYPLICHLCLDFNKYDCLKGKRRERQRSTSCSKPHLGERPGARYRHILTCLSYRITSGDYCQVV